MEKLPAELEPLVLKELTRILSLDEENLEKLKYLREIITEIYELGFCNGRVVGVKSSSDIMIDAVLATISNAGNKH